MSCSLSAKPKSVKELKFKLHSGDLMPLVGFGTYQITGTEEIKNALDNALAAGFRHIDTAQVYHNEEDIGKALKELLPKYNLTRKDIFITSKINIADKDPDAYRSVNESLKALDTDYIDLYLIHHPAIIFWDRDENGQIKLNGFSSGPKNVEIRDKKWQGLVKALKEGLVRNIGVSNYGVKHLKELLANDHGVKPATNQIHWSPLTQPRDVLELCQKENILVVAYSSLGGTGDRFKVTDNPEVKKIAEKLNKSVTQILLRWPLQEGIAIIPKARSKEHVEEDIALDFVIPDEDVKTLNNLVQEPHSWFDYNKID